ncbi:hypothetical protein PENSTE_c005G04527 [Penicillium steckii]|uniref:Yeast cell wall synthesis Kre9/Knh1-like N-terminal domain-containing protein n=1 Tax=Penicillium steckii TaxID=303698 RepID=A0A1V6TJB1_9EURO|nr:hypothetical protein PENSTE_c005G04527 [Penicillium steckii]
MRLSIAALAPLAISVAGLSVDEPKKGAEIDASGSFDVKWSSVDSDPSSFDLYLVNNAIYPSVNKKIATGIDTSKGSYHVKSIDVSAGHGYQVNLLSDSTQNTGILAQSQQFNVTGSSDSTSTTTATTLTSSTSTKDTTTGSQTKTTSGTNTATTASSASSSGIASGSVSGTPTGSSTSAPTASLNAGGSIVAHPLAAAGVFAGAIAFAL